MDGYIMLYKKTAEWQWYKDGNTLRVFIDLLLDANFEDSKRGLIEIKRGQCLTSLNRIQERTGLTCKQIRTSLIKLEKSGEIGKQVTNRYSIITINKYNDYQKQDKQRASKGQSKGNIKEYKEEKEINNNIKEKINKKEKYGQFANVLLTDDEYQKLKERFIDYQEKIENLSYYIKSKGDKYKSHYGTILNWARKDNKQETLPEWFDKDIKKEKEGLEELDKILEEFK